MITEVKAYSSWRSAPELLLSEDGRAETDLLQVLDVQGVEPVNAAINTSPFGSVDGEDYVGSSVGKRNIILVLHPNPDWMTWTYEKLRKLVYSYFMPKMRIRLVFESDDTVPVEISGYVEGIAPNIFTKDPEYHISIICPQPYFTALEETIVAGSTIRYGDAPVLIEYAGNIEAGISIQVSRVSDPNPVLIGVQIGNPAISYLTVDATVDPTKYFELSSLPMRKYVRNIAAADGALTSLLSFAHIVEGEGWPLLQPGENELSVITNAGVQDWQLRYFERFGGL